MNLNTSNNNSGNPYDVGLPPKQPRFPTHHSPSQTRLGPKDYRVPYPGDTSGYGPTAHQLPPQYQPPLPAQIAIAQQNHLGPNAANILDMKTNLISKTVQNPYLLPLQQVPLMPQPYAQNQNQPDNRINSFQDENRGAFNRKRQKSGSPEQNRNFISIFHQVKRRKTSRGEV